MNELIFSLNATVPLFLIAFIGYRWYKSGMLTKEFADVANKFIFRITLPALVIRDLSTADFKEVWDFKYVLFCALTTTICFFVIWGLSRIFIKDDEIRGAFVQGSFRSSAAILGFALIQNIYGNSVMMPLMIVGCVPLYNMFAVLVLTFEGKGAKGKSMKDALRDIIKNPIIIGIIIGVCMSLTGVKLPTMFQSVLSSLASLTSPLALIALGVGFEGKKALAKMKPSVIASVIKLVVLPVIFLPVAIKLGFRDDALICVLIMLGSPTTVSCYIMAKSMGNDEVLSSSIIMITTIMSAFSVTAFLFILRSMGLV